MWTRSLSAVIYVDYMCIIDDAYSKPHIDNNRNLNKL